MRKKNAVMMLNVWYPSQQQKWAMNHGSQNRLLHIFGFINPKMWSRLFQLFPLKIIISIIFLTKYQIIFRGNFFSLQLSKYMII